MIEDPLAEEILRGTFKGKDTITVRVEGADDTKQLKFEATRQGRVQGPGRRRRGDRVEVRAQETLIARGDRGRFDVTGREGTRTPPSLFS